MYDWYFIIYLVCKWLYLIFIAEGDERERRSPLPEIVRSSYSRLE